MLHILSHREMGAQNHWTKKQCLWSCLKLGKNKKCLKCKSQKDHSHYNRLSHSYSNKGGCKSEEIRGVCFCEHFSCPGSFLKFLVNSIRKITLRRFTFKPLLTYNSTVKKRRTYKDMQSSSGQKTFSDSKKNIIYLILKNVITNIWSANLRV